LIDRRCEVTPIDQAPLQNHSSNTFLIYGSPGYA
jgi:hypothetical protein